MNAPFARLLAVFLLLGTAPCLVADTIFDNGGPLTTEHTGLFSNVNGPFQAADNFVLDAGLNTIRDVHWFGIYQSNNIPTDDDFTIRIYADDSGLPADDPLHEFHIGSAMRMDTGLDNTETQTTFDIFEYWAVIPDTTLNAGETYWLVVLNDHDDGDPDTLDPRWAWSVSAVNSVNTAALRNLSDSVEWFAIRVDLAFSLTDDGTVIPTPAAATMAAPLLAWLGFARPRRMRKR